MKNFRAIYNTEILNNVKYDFQAENMDDAKKYAENKFNTYGSESFRLVEIK